MDIEDLKKFITDFATKSKKLFATEVLSESYEGATVFRDMFPPS